jgi:hypothetical protein
MTTVLRDRRILPALVATIVAAFLLIPMITSAPLVRAQSQEEDPCADVPRSTFEDRDEAFEVHRHSIDCVDFYDISSGDSTGRFYRPFRLVTRGQMATFIVNTLVAAGLSDRLPNGDPPDEFNDIADNTHRESINILARIEVVRGTAGGAYQPDLLVRRDQMASFLLQAKEWAYQEDYNTSNSYFGDVPASNPHYGNVNAAYEQGLVRGTRSPEGDTPNSGEYQPGRNVPRQNMASFLSNELREVDGAPEQFCAASPSPSATGSPRPTTSSSPSPGGGGGGNPITDIIGGDESPSANPSTSPSARPSASASPTTTTSPSPTGSPCATPSGSASPSPTASASTSPSPRPSTSTSPSPSGSASPTPPTSPSPCPGGLPVCTFPAVPQLP